MIINFSEYVEGETHKGEFRKLGAGRFLQIQDLKDKLTQESQPEEQLEAMKVILEAIRSTAIDETSKALIDNIAFDKLGQFIEEITNGSTATVSSPSAEVGDVKAEVKKA